MSELKHREQEHEANALRINAGRKPKFGDMMRNPWASESNPQRDGYFVRERRQGGRFNPGHYYEFTDKCGKFWEMSAKYAFFIGAQPEATKPAQDLSAAKRIDLGHGSYIEFERKTSGGSGWLLRNEGGNLVRALSATEVLLIDAALASPADALVARDSETARLEFVFANGLPMKRGGEYRCHGYPGEWFKTEREAIDAAIQAQKDGHG